MWKKSLGGLSGTFVVGDVCALFAVQFLMMLPLRVQRAEGVEKEERSRGEDRSKTKGVKPSRDRGGDRNASRGYGHKRVHPLRNRRRS